MPKTPNPIDQAADFHVSELFFSTTDLKGRITGCNDVFTRIAGYAPQEILGAPHNIIRHPEMPKCVFRLLWSHLEAGKPIGAYVKNLTSRGEYYWVFALALPIEGGYLSIRLKPTGGTREVVEKLYGQLCETEQRHGNRTHEGMERATEELLEALNTLGFASYDQFMSHCLRVEIAARGKQVMTRSRESSFASGNQMASVLGELELLERLQSHAGEQTESLLTASEAIHTIALNIGISASRFGDQGIALGVLGQQASTVSTEITEEARKLDGVREELSRSLESTSLQVSVAALVAEMRNDFSKLAAACDLPVEKQIKAYGATCADLSAMLAAVLSQALSAAVQGRKQLRASLRAFTGITERFQSTLFTTHISRVTGLSLASTLTGGEWFCGLLDEMVDLAESARGQLDDLMTDAELVKSSVDQWDFSSCEVHGVASLTR